MIKTIVYASDLGVLSTYSLAYVEQLAKQLSAKVILLHVVPSIDCLAAAVIKSQCNGDASSGALTDSHIERLLATIREQTIERLMADEFGVDFSYLLADIVIKSGAPAKTIIEYADEISADTIVIGNCAEPIHHRHTLGSVASKVLQLARIPVFVVPINAVTALTRHASQGDQSLGC
ncbi:MAG: universal stress protein [Marinagarivorans sp.]|nr:universal stress protein [Marinagarivorans sp.]